jgi:hypothetical protein
MGIDSRLIGFMTYKRQEPEAQRILKDIIEELGYNFGESEHNHKVDKLDDGTQILLYTCEAPTTDASHELANAFGVDLDDANTYPIDPEKVDWAEARALAESGEYWFTPKDYYAIRMSLEFGAKWIFDPN